MADRSDARISDRVITAVVGPKDRKKDERARRSEKPHEFRDVPRLRQWLGERLKAAFLQETQGDHRGAVRTGNEAIDAAKAWLQKQPDKFPQAERLKHANTFAGVVAQMVSAVSSVDDGDPLVTAADIARIGHKSRGNLRTEKWPEPRIKGTGSSPWWWSYRELLPKLRELFPKDKWPDEP